jgi:hypothetical protein
MNHVFAALSVALGCSCPLPRLLAQQEAKDDAKVVRVFVFAGQSNMVGSHSVAAAVDSYPPFVHVAEPRPDVRYWIVKVASGGTSLGTDWNPDQPSGFEDRRQRHQM